MRNSFMPNQLDQGYIYVPDLEMTFLFTSAMS